MTFYLFDRNKKLDIFLLYLKYFTNLPIFKKFNLNFLQSLIYFIDKIKLPLTLLIERLESEINLVFL